MRPYTIIMLFFLALASCHERQENKATANIDHLSKWFNENEDSLYDEFIRQVQTDYLCKTCDSNWGEVAYQRIDSTSYMGKFSLQAKKYCDSIEITYFFNKSATPKARILLSTEYNRKFTKALDTILNFIAPKRFTVEKFEQPDSTSDIFTTDGIDVVVKDLRIDMKPHDSLQNITVLIHNNSQDKTITPDSKDYLKHRLFGEELLLKKINNIDFRFTDKINDNLPSLEEARHKLK